MLKFIIELGIEPFIDTNKVLKEVRAQIKENLNYHVGSVNQNLVKLLYIYIKKSVKILF